MTFLEFVSENFAAFTALIGVILGLGGSFLVQIVLRKWAMKDAKLQWKRDRLNTLKEQVNDLFGRVIYFSKVFQTSGSASEKDFLRIMEEHSQVSARMDPSLDNELSGYCEKFKKEMVEVIGKHNIDTTRLNEYRNDVIGRINILLEETYN